MSIQPIRTKVLVRPDPPDEISLGGIYVPDSVKKRPMKGTVVACGNGLKKRPMNVKPGMKVHHVLDAGQPFIENGETLYLMESIDILAAY